MSLSLARRLMIVAATAAVFACPQAIAGDYDDNSRPQAWRGSTKDDGYPVPQPPPVNYDQRSYREDVPPRRIVAECLSKFDIRHALKRQGFHDYDAVELRGEVAFMLARNDEGRRFELEVDSCTGEVIHAQLQVIYAEPPRVYHDRYGVPRPVIGLHGEFGGRRHRW